MEGNKRLDAAAAVNRNTAFPFKEKNDNINNADLHSYPREGNKNCEMKKGKKPPLLQRLDGCFVP